MDTIKSESRTCLAARPGHWGELAWSWAGARVLRAVVVVAVVVASGDGRRAFSRPLPLSRSYSPFTRRKLQH